MPTDRQRELDIEALVENIVEQVMSKPGAQDTYVTQTTVSGLKTVAGSEELTSGRYELPACRRCNSEADTSTNHRQHRYITQFTQHTAERALMCGTCLGQEACKQCLDDTEDWRYCSCPICGLRLLRTNRVKHLRSHFQIRLFKCAQCGKALSTKERLVSHLDRHSAIKHRCHICLKEYSTRATLAKHKDDVHSGRYYRCPHCNDTFAQERSVYRHMRRRHVHALPYVCEMCPERFGLIRQLKEHQLTHEQFKAFTPELPDVI